MGNEAEGGFVIGGPGVFFAQLFKPKGGVNVREQDISIGRKINFRDVQAVRLANALGVNLPAARDDNLARPHASCSCLRGAEARL